MREKILVRVRLLFFVYFIIYEFFWIRNLLNIHVYIQGTIHMTYNTTHFGWLPVIASKNYLEDHLQLFESMVRGQMAWNDYDISQVFYTVSQV